jgi:amidase
VPVSAEVRRPVLETAELLRSLGHEVVERDPLYPPVAVLSMFALMMHGLADEIERLPTPELLERRIRAEGRTARLIPDWLAHRAVAARGRLSERALRPIADYDVLMTPVLGRPPVPVGHLEGLGQTRAMARILGFMPFTPAQNFTGQPAMSIPAGVSADGLPEAVHLVGKPNDGTTLISLAAQLESARPWARRRPPMATAAARSG